MNTFPASLPTNSEMKPQDSKFLAQMISMAPFMFQTALCLRDFGIFKILIEKQEGITISDLKDKSSLSQYSLEVLLDAGESCGLISIEQNLYHITDAGRFIETDAITKINMNFTQDVCYKGLFNLKEALETNTPSGLKHLGNWKTLYEGLSILEEPAKKSWFEFDHFYSDDCFPRVLPMVLKERPQKILDIGGNTGKFALASTKEDSHLQVTIVDHPGQIRLAKENIARNNLLDRVHFYEADLLIKETPLPKNHDLIWMSQFLSCFSEDEIISILVRAREALPENGKILILETFTDDQKFEAAKFCLDMTSLYFTVIANGKSRMYRKSRFLELLKKAELEVYEEIPHIRLNHTLLKCRKPQPQSQGDSK